MLNGNRRLLNVACKSLRLSGDSMFLFTKNGLVQNIENNVLESVIESLKNATKFQKLSIISIQVFIYVVFENKAKFIFYRK